MQKIKFINANGDEIDFTSGCYGVTGWKGLSNANLSLQTQKVPDYDGSVYIDGLLENREIELNLVINDGNNLQTRYEKRQELCKTLNPKLGEGYLYYENDAVQRRIKAISETPIIENKNADESGSVKATLVFDCTGVYWEDLEETVVELTSFEETSIINNGDISCAVKIEADTQNIPAYSIKNDTQKINIRNIEDYRNILVNTEFGNKKVLGGKINWNFGNINYQRRIIYEKGMFICIGKDTILTSSDGINWTNRILTTNILTGIVYSKRLDLFVVCGVTSSSANRPYIYTSSDGISWTSYYYSTTEHQYFQDIIYSEYSRLFVGVSSTNSIETSSDGITWTQVNPGLTYKVLWGVTYSESLHLFVAVGESGTILTSSNGTSWVSRTSGVSNQLNKITYSESLGLFVAVGNNGVILTSSDGINWNTVTSNVSAILSNVKYFEILGLFVIVGNNGVILTSFDGINWIEQIDNIGEKNLSDVTYSVDLGLFISVGQGVFSSFDLLDWTNIIGRVSSSDIYRIAYSESLHLFVAVGKYLTILKSSDGINWVNVSYDNSNSNFAFNDIIYSESLGLFVAVGFYVNRGIISTSSDGIIWRGGNIGSSLSGIGLTGVTYSEYLGLFVVVGASGTILTSSDGINWTQTTTEITNVNKITYSESLHLFVAIGGSNKWYISTSSDGINWTQIQLPENLTPHGITYSESLGLFVAVGNNRIYTSTDGINWNISYNKTISLQNVRYFESLGLFIAVGNARKILTSPNGQVWTEKDFSEVSINIYDISYIEDLSLFVIVGSDGYIFYSTTPPDTNIIDHLTSDSDMTFNLKPGENKLLVYNTQRTFNTKLTYRQKYIGV